MISAKIWAYGNPALCVELVQDIQANALTHALSVIGQTTDDGLPLEAALTLIRIKAGNLTKRSRVSPVSDNPKEDAFYEKVEASITTNQT